MKRVTYVEIGLLEEDELLGDLDPTKFVKIRFKVEDDDDDRSHYSSEAVYPKADVIQWLNRWLAADKPATTLEPPTNA